MIVQCEVVVFFLVTVHFNKPQLMSVPKIVEITHAIYRDFPRDDCVTKSQQRARCAERLHLHVLPPSAQSKKLAWARDPIIENSAPGQRSTSRKTGQCVS